MTEKPKPATAAKVLNALIDATDPAPGHMIKIIEVVAADGLALNWDASFGEDEPAAVARFESALAKLRREHRQIDWSDVTQIFGQRSLTTGRIPD